MSPSDEQQRLPPTGARASFNRSDDDSHRWAVGSMSDGRASGELEGSTLGNSSREGDRRMSGHRRGPSSSGFLLDSLPRSKSSKITSHRPRPSEPSAEKRNAPDADVMVRKKRSRFPWSRHKNPALEPDPPAVATGSTTTQQTPTQTSDVQASTSSSRGPSGANDTGMPQPGLDRDSLQIVNLALNLNESRRRTASGLSSGPGQIRPISISQPTGSPMDKRISSPRAKNADYDIYATPTPPHGEQPHSSHLSGQSPVLELLPSNVVDDNRAYEFSESTYARAERARCHFDLFYEYLRLLPLLPPLRRTERTDEYGSLHAPASDSSLTRGYNPLQMIRNRRIRYREKCSIDAEAAGWHDVGNVHEWINSINREYGHQDHDQNSSIKLPSFQQGQRRGLHGEPNDADLLAASPPSSLRRISRTNSSKATAPRPRLDWKFSPSELLADAAWVEDETNKSKIIDKDGNHLYPDPTELILVDSNRKSSAQSKQQLSPGVDDFATGALSSRPDSLSSPHPALAKEFKSVGRGRHTKRLQSHSHSNRSRSVSSSRKGSRWGKVGMRSSSVSSDSSAESLGQHIKRPSEYQKDSEKASDKSAARIAGLRESRAKSPAAPVSNVDYDQFHQLRSLSLNTKTGETRRNESISSIGSIDDRYNPRMSLEGMDSTAPNSPIHAGYFPSIAVNLSPPSSRSPSPAKKGLRHKIVSRHERSKSKLGDREQRKHDHESHDPEVPPQHAPLPSFDNTPRSSTLEPSPLPDVVSSHFPGDHGTTEGHRVDNYGGRKGQRLPESKLRGIFKGPGRIAEIVGNEVSKVGDMILKKDQAPDSRKSSSATTLSSDESDYDDEEQRTDKRAGSKGLLPGRLTRRNSEKGTSSRSFIPSLPSFTSPLRQDGRTGSTDAVDFGSPRERIFASGKQDERETQRRMAFSRSKTLDFGSPLNARGRAKPHVIKDSSVPFSLTRPPVTGLAQARASPGPSAERRRPLGSTTRAWSISDRSLHTLNDSGVPGKTEVERTRTLLLSSGIKAREITRRANSVRDPPPHWLQSSLAPNTSIPRVTRLVEFDLAAQSLLRRFEASQYSFQQSMHHFATTSSSPLRTQLKDLETLVTQSITPRVRATADDAEDLCVQLNSTSTLAVKSLSDALDRGLRKRRRRLRFARRAGFVVLEWALVGMLWWVWLIVMAFKVVRGVFRGVISGARWILWL